MSRRRLVIGLTCALVVSTVSWSTSGAEPAPAPAGEGLAVYAGEVDAATVAAIVALGVDRQELRVVPVAGADGRFAVEAILSADQAEAVSTAGNELAPADAGAARRAQALATGVFRHYSGPGGLQEELIAQAAAYPHIAQRQAIGTTVNGKEITAVRVTGNPNRVALGRRPTTVYIGAQHAREWITPEMVRRLLDHVLTGYGTDDAITDLVDDHELWFIPVANPDGYDFTFEEGQRLWRKNLRDNDGNGTITVGDGVDLNRNYPTRWGYDNEGSSPNPASDTYRGPEPASEPETQAIDRLFKRITPQFLVNYHSAAELLLHGIGWQVATPSPDDVVYQAMVGDDADPAIAGYDPDISAELYTTNGDTDSHLQEAYGALGFTPEMSTCEAAVQSVPDDEWDLDDCGGSGFDFPDDEALIQAEFEKNVPFAIAVAQSAADPDDPVSVVGIDTPDFVVDAFDVSYGDRQQVAVTAKRDLRGLRMAYRINGGRVRTTAAREWDGGERYGFENDDYYAEFRGLVRGTALGDEVEVWFSATTSGRGEQRGGGNRRVESDRFRYEVVSDSDAPVLLIANEDYTGVNPEDVPSMSGPKYLDAHLAALAANGVDADVWDVDAQGVPHHLGVLDHYAAVIWYLGDNRLTQDPEDALIRFGNNQLPDLAVAERQQYLTLAVRDYLNEGGKLVYAGETAGYYGLLGSALGGIYYGLDGAPDEECVVTVDPFSDCLLLADDFTQYWLGTFGRTALEGAGGVVGTAGDLAGATAAFGGPAVEANPVDEPGALRPTSDVLDPAEFPWFGPSNPVADYVDPAGPFVAIEGGLAVVAPHADDSWMRLGRTYDLTGFTAADAPTFEAQLSFDVEEGYDHVIVEARTVGEDDWTTLPDINGATSSAVPAECEVGFLLDEHPALSRYLTLGVPCLPTGTSGAWNSFTGTSPGWIPVAFDLSAFAGSQVEIIVSYVTDPFTGGTGVIVDDTRLTTVAGPSEAEGFEDGLGAWVVLNSPEGSPGNTSAFEVTAALGGITAAIATADTVMFGFGLEQLEADDARAAIVGATLAFLTESS
jgi:hypothetical protein